MGNVFVTQSHLTELCISDGYTHPEGIHAPTHTRAPEHHAES
jgi:hypothetical protein